MVSPRARVSGVVGVPMALVSPRRAEAGQISLPDSGDITGQQRNQKVWGSLRLTTLHPLLVWFLKA